MEIYRLPWEEVNSSVFKNAQIYHLKKKKQKIGVIVPFYFSGIYKDADFIKSISNKCLKKHGIESYKNVLEYLLDNRIVHYYNKLISKLITIGLNFMGKYYYSPRLNKFYIRNGLEKKALNDLSKNLKFKYYRCNNFFDIYENSYTSNDLSIHFQKNFQYLYDMIEDGSLYNSSLNKLSFKKKYLAINDFIYSKAPKLIIRTRNFKAKATIHNSKKDQLNLLISEILNQSKSMIILNLGCPLLELDIKNSDRYFEVDHELTFSEELFLCQMADLNIMTAEAGLFTAFAASNIRIVQIDNEWSSDHLTSPIELFEARKKKGILDVDIRRELRQKNYFLASKKIIKNLN